MNQPQEIQQCVAQAAKNYQTQFKTPLARGVAGRVYRQFLQPAAYKVDESQAFNALVKDQRWVMHGRAQGRAVMGSVVLLAGGVGAGFWGQGMKASDPDSAKFLLGLMAFCVCLGLVCVVATMVLGLAPIPLKWPAKRPQPEPQSKDPINPQKEFSQSEGDITARHPSASIFTAILTLAIAGAALAGAARVALPGAAKTAEFGERMVEQKMNPWREHDKIIGVEFRMKEPKDIIAFLKNRDGFHRSNGMDLEFEDLEKRAWRLAIREKREDLVRYLMEHAIAGPHGSHDGLAYAAELGQPNIVEYLLEKEVDLHAWNDAALRGALVNGHAAIVELLLKNGGDPWAKGMSEAIEKATAAGHEQAVGFVAAARLQNPLVYGAGAAGLVFLLYALFAVARLFSRKKV
jgi:hypothetical protein